MIIDEIAVAVRDIDLEIFDDIAAPSCFDPAANCIARAPRDRETFSHQTAPILHAGADFAHYVFLVGESGVCFVKIEEGRAQDCYD